MQTSAYWKFLTELVISPILWYFAILSGFYLCFSLFWSFSNHEFKAVAITFGAKGEHAHSVVVGDLMSVELHVESLTLSCQKRRGRGCVGGAGSHLYYLNGFVVFCWPYGWSKGFFFFFTFGAKSSTTSKQTTRWRDAMPIYMIDLRC